MIFLSWKDCLYLLSLHPLILQPSNLLLTITIHKMLPNPIDTHLFAFSSNWRNIDTTVQVLLPYTFSFPGTSLVFCVPVGHFPSSFWSLLLSPHQNLPATHLVFFLSSVLRSLQQPPWLYIPYIDRWRLTLPLQSRALLSSVLSYAIATWRLVLDVSQTSRAKQRLKKRSLDSC